VQRLLWGGHSCPPAFDFDFVSGHGFSRAATSQRKTRLQPLGPRRKHTPLLSAIARQVQLDQGCEFPAIEGSQQPHKCVEAVAERRLSAA